MVLAQLIAPFFLLCIPAGQSVNGPEFCETCFGGFSAKIIMKADISVPLYTTNSGQTVVRVVSIPDTAVVRVKCLNSKNQMNSELIQVIEVVWYWSQPSPSVSTYSPSTAPITSSAINRTTSTDIGKSTATPTQFPPTEYTFGSTEEPTAATTVTMEQPTTITTQEDPTSTAVSDITNVTVEQPTTITTLEVTTTSTASEITTLTVEQPTTITTLEVPTTTAAAEKTTVTVEQSTTITTLEVPSTTAATDITTVTVEQPTTITTLEVTTTSTVTDITTVTGDQPTTISTLKVPTTTAATDTTTVTTEQSTDVTTLKVPTSIAVTDITIGTKERSTPVSTFEDFTSTPADRTAVTEEHMTPFNTIKIRTTTEALVTTDLSTETDGAQTLPSREASFSIDGSTTFEDLTTVEASTTVEDLTITDNLTTDEDISTSIIPISTTVDAPTTNEEATINQVPSSAENHSKSPAEVQTTVEDISITDAPTTSAALNFAEDTTTPDNLEDSTTLSTVHEPSTTEGVDHVFHSTKDFLETTFAPAILQLQTTVESWQSSLQSADATEGTLTTSQENSDRPFLGLRFEGSSVTAFADVFSTSSYIEGFTMVPSESENVFGFSEGPELPLQLPSASYKADMEIVSSRSNDDGTSFMKDSFQVNPRVKRETEPANRLLMYFKENRKSFYLFEIRLEFDVGPAVIPDLKKNIFYSKHASGLKHFETPLNNTYSCSSVEQIMLGSKSEDFFLSISDVKVSTFMQSCVPPKDWVCGTPLPDFGPANQLGNTLAMVFGSLLGVSVIVGAVVHIVKKHRSVKSARDSVLTKESTTDAPERLTA